VAQKHRAPPGWLFPLAPVEVHTYFPGVARVSFGSVPMAMSDRCIVFHLGWYPGSRSRQPVLSIHPVPAESRDAVREWFEEVAWPDAHSWMKDVKRRAPKASESSHFYWCSPGPIRV
jgi:hypothetical protein